MERHLQRRARVPDHAVPTLVPVSDGRALPNAESVLLTRVARHAHVRQRYSRAQHLDERHGERGAALPPTEGGVRALQRVDVPDRVGRGRHVQLGAHAARVAAGDEYAGARGRAARPSLADVPAVDAAAFDTAVVGSTERLRPRPAVDHEGAESDVRQRAAVALQLHGGRRPHHQRTGDHVRRTRPGVVHGANHRPYLRRSQLANASTAPRPPSVAPPVVCHRRRVLVRLRRTGYVRRFRSVCPNSHIVLRGASPRARLQHTTMRRNRRAAERDGLRVAKRRNTVLRRRAWRRLHKVRQVPLARLPSKWLVVDQSRLPPRCSSAVASGAFRPARASTFKLQLQCVARVHLPRKLSHRPPERVLAL